MVEELVKGRIDSIEIAEIVLLTTGSTLFVNKTIGQLLHGYIDPLLSTAFFFRPDKVKSAKFSLMNDVNKAFCFVNFLIDY